MHDAPGTAPSWPPEVLAYAAGVIDSDGSIGIQRETWPIRLGRATQPTFSERVTIRQIEPEAVDLIHQTFGGSRHVIRPTERRKDSQPLQCVVLADRKASTLLAALLPYLRIKRGQAKLCLELRELKNDSLRARFAIGRGHRGGGRRPEALTAAMDAVYLEMRRLNRVDDRAARRNPKMLIEASTDADPEASSERGGRS